MNSMEEMQIKDNLSYYTYTTGAHLTPIFYRGRWVWMVAEFEDDTFCDGECINPDIDIKMELTRSQLMRRQKIANLTGAKFAGDLQALVNKFNADVVKLVHSAQESEGLD
jgi:hypothetical protein